MTRLKITKNKKSKIKKTLKKIKGGRVGVSFTAFISLFCIFFVYVVLYSIYINFKSNSIVSNHSGTEKVISYLNTIDNLIENSYELDLDNKSIDSTTRMSMDLVPYFKPIYEQFETQQKKLEEEGIETNPQFYGLLKTLYKDLSKQVALPGRNFKRELSTCINNAQNFTVAKFTANLTSTDPSISDLSISDLSISDSNLSTFTEFVDLSNVADKYGNEIKTASFLTNLYFYNSTNQIFDDLKNFLNEKKDYQYILILIILLISLVRSNYQYKELEKDMKKKELENFNKMYKNVIESENEDQQNPKSEDIEDQQNPKSGDNEVNYDVLHPDTTNLETMIQLLNENKKAYNEAASVLFEDITKIENIMISNNNVQFRVLDREKLKNKEKTTLSELLNNPSFNACSNSDTLLENLKLSDDANGILKYFTLHNHNLVYKVKNEEVQFCFEAIKEIFKVDKSSLKNNILRLLNVDNIFKVQKQNILFVENDDPVTAEIVDYLNKREFTTMKVDSKLLTIGASFLKSNGSGQSQQAVSQNILDRLSFKTQNVESNSNMFSQTIENEVENAPEKNNSLYKPIRSTDSPYKEAKKREIYLKKGKEIYSPIKKIQLRKISITNESKNDFYFIKNTDSIKIPNNENEITLTPETRMVIKINQNFIVLDFSDKFSITESKDFFLLSNTDEDYTRHEKWNNDNDENYFKMTYNVSIDDFTKGHQAEAKKILNRNKNEKLEYMIFESKEEADKFLKEATPLYKKESDVRTKIVLNSDADADPDADADLDLDPSKGKARKNKISKKRIKKRKKVSAKLRVRKFSV